MCARACIWSLITHPHPRTHACTHFIGFSQLCDVIRSEVVNYSIYYCSVTKQPKTCWCKTPFLYVFGVFRTKILTGTTWNIFLHAMVSENLPGQTRSLGRCSSQARLTQMCCSLIGIFGDLRWAACCGTYIRPCSMGRLLFSHHGNWILSWFNGQGRTVLHCYDLTQKFRNIASALPHWSRMSQSPTQDSGKEWRGGKNSVTVHEEPVEWETVLQPFLENTICQAPLIQKRKQMKENYYTSMRSRAGTPNNSFRTELLLYHAALGSSICLSELTH